LFALWEPYVKEMNSIGLIHARRSSGSGSLYYFLLSQDSIDLPYKAFKDSVFTQSLSLIYFMESKGLRRLISLPKIFVTVIFEIKKS